MQCHHKLSPAYPCYSQQTLATPSCSSAQPLCLVSSLRSAHRTSAQRMSISLSTLSNPCHSPVSTTSVEVTNNCNEQIDPGFYPVVYNSAGEATGGFVLDSHEHAKVTLPTTGWTGIIWPRTGCDEYGRCETGQCPGGISCTAFPGPVGGATTARFIIANETYAYSCSSSQSTKWADPLFRQRWRRQLLSQHV